jgi:hydroxymethylpyrimidine/phosphomethylpyrimidine kinase
LINTTVDTCQLESIFDDEVPIAIKIGMLTSSSIISTIVNYIRDLPSRPLIILDPVMVSTSGHDLLPEEALDAIRGDLLSNVDWITPNIPEAKRLTGWDKEVKTLLDMRSLAGGISEVCDVPTILLKGGHLSIELQEILALEKDCTILWAEGDAINATGVLSLFRSYLALDSPSELVVDIMITKGELLHTLIVGRKVDSTSTHGTGCTLSSALACVWAIESRDSPRNGMPLGLFFAHAIRSRYESANGLTCC